MSKGIALIAHPYPAFSAGISQSILQSGIVSGCEYAVNARETAEKLHGASYSFLLMDDELPGLKTFEFLAHLQNACPDLKTIVIVTGNETTPVKKYFKKNVAGCIHKQAKVDEYAEAVKQAAAGNKTVCRHLAGMLITSGKPDFESEESAAEKAKLSAREKEIFPYLIQKMAEQKIADKCFITLETVRQHRKHIRRKLEKVGLLYLLDDPWQIFKS